MFTLRDISSGRMISVESGVLLIEGLAAAGLALEDSFCGRQGLCGKCLVRISRNNECWTEVLACQTPVLSDLAFEVPGSGSRKYAVLDRGAGTSVALAPAVRKVFVKSLARGMALAWEELNAITAIPGGPMTSCEVNVARHLAGFVQQGKPFTAVVAGNRIVGLEEGDTASVLCGMAFDVGTTTVVGYLVNLLDGKVLATVSALNPQVRFGADVITRITKAEREPGGLDELRECIVTSIDQLIGNAASQSGMRREDIYDLVFVGNPCMHHLFFGIQPAGLGRTPYQPVVREQITCSAAQAGVEANKLATLTWLPAVAGFVGADTIGMLLAHPLNELGESTLALDIGTNGEIVLACRGELWACSTAAGPAFEGTSMTSGIRAQSGAIDRAWIEDGNMEYHVLDEAPPRGICGSGLVDAIAALIEKGLIDDTGRMIRPEDGQPLANRFIEWERSLAFVLVPGAVTGGRDILIAQNDVRELQLAKAAITTGLLILLQEAGLALEDVKRVILAGAFGMYLTIGSIRTIGLLPAVLCDKIVSVGNAAGAGAQIALVSESNRQLATKTASRIRYVELAGRRGFSDQFIEELSFGRR